MEANPESQEQVLRVTGTVPAVGLPGLHYRAGVSTVERHGASFVRRRFRPDVPETGGRVHYGNCRAQARHQALPCQRVPEQADTVYRLQHPARHQHTHGQVQ